VRLRVVNLSIRLGGRVIVDRMSFDAAGWFGLLGANGSGKTTLLRGLAARVPIEADEVSWGGLDLTRADERRGKTFGYAPPVDTFPPTVPAGDLIALVADLGGCDPLGDVRLREILAIDALATMPTGRMSAGTKQRLSLFFAFLGNPSVVLLDEPFNWLDPVSTAALGHWFRQWSGKGGCLVTALHDVAIFAAGCDGGLVIDAGKVAHRYEAEAMQRGRRDLEAFERELLSRFEG